jgi:alpha-ketoglutarate-dependent taurine dioxygenase
MAPLREGERLPLLVLPAVPGLHLAAWLRNNRALIEARLLEHGGLLFRNFTVNGPEAFEECVKALSGELVEYTYRSTPRKRVAGNVYTSTEYPADRGIPLHNEMSYSRTWPLKIWFFCVTPADQGGLTPIADSRTVLDRIPAAVRERFARLGVAYVRNYGLGLDLSWQEVFQTADRMEVERICRAGGIELEWKGDDRLTTRQVCQAVADHPKTGERLWFNQAHLFHVSSLDPSARQLLETLPEDELPRNAYYGDGTPIEPSVLDDIRQAYADTTVLFHWQHGDLLLLDNMLTAHGRTPFQGPRTVLAGMADRWGSDDVREQL